MVDVPSKVLDRDAVTLDTGIDGLLAPGCRLSDHRTGRALDRDALMARSQACAAGLLQNGCQRGDRVVIAMADPLTVIITLFACWRAGLIAVLVNPAIVAAERHRVTAATGAALWLDTDDDLGGTAAATMEPLEPHDPALILMTSGTTGVPKGITLTLGALSARVHRNGSQIGAPTLARTLSVLPVFFGHGLIGTILTPLAAGGHVILWPTPALGELAQLGDVLDQTQAGFLSAVPSFWRMALRLSQPPGTALKQVHVGSEVLSMELWQGIADWSGTRNVLNMYGLTETANWVGGAGLDQAGGKTGFVGRPWLGDMAVLDEAGVIIASGSGEVLLRSDACMAGIWGDPNATKAAFFDGWLRTGDLGEVDDAGLTLKGRLKSLINRGGVKILAEEIEQMLERHPDVIEAAAFALPDPVSGEAVGAAVVMRKDADLPVDALRDWCRGEVRAEAVPSRIAILDTLVRNDRGKLMRDATRDLVLDTG